MDFEGRLATLHSNCGICKKVNIDQASVFSTLGNETRLRCLYLAAKHGEICVCETVDTLEISQPSASKAFKALKTVGLVEDRREGNWIYYRLSEGMPKWARSIVFIAMRELERSEAFIADNHRFEQSRIRNRAACP